MKVRLLIALVLTFVASIPAIAQTCSQTQYTNKLICTLPQLFSPIGLTLPNPTHVAHFAGNSETQLALPVNQGTGQALAILPLGSSGSGTTFTLDSEGHAIPTSEDSLGPILTERANVIGKKAISLGVAYQYFDFSHLDGIRLSSFPAVLLHKGWTDQLPALNPDGTPVFMQDYVITQNQVHLNLNQAVIYGVFGLSKRMDVSIEVPIQSAHLRVVSTANIIRTQGCELNASCKSSAAESGEFHYFSGYSSTLTGSTLNENRNPKEILDSTSLTFPNQTFSIQMAQTKDENGNIGAAENFPARTSLPTTDASGIGDITLRGKFEVIRREKFVASVGLGIRFPSGDANNFLGTGAYGVIPFGAATYKARLSPHVRFGYEWNGKSILGGDPSQITGLPTTASLPAAWLYSGGADYRAAKWLTVDADLIGERVLDVTRLTFGSYNLYPNNTTGQTPTAKMAVQSIKASSGTSGYSSDSVALGAKIRLKGELVLIGNATIRVDDGGLRADVVPLVGLSYAF